MNPEEDESDNRLGHRNEASSEADSSNMLPCPQQEREKPRANLRIRARKQKRDFGKGQYRNEEITKCIEEGFG